MNYIIDCSFSSALFLPDEKSSEIRDYFLTLKKNDQIFVPLLWWYETSSVLNISVKRERLKHGDIKIIIDLLSKLKIETDVLYGADFAKEIFNLAQMYHVSSYDAAYLELAIRKKARLKSLDEDLITAAGKIGIN